VQGVAKIGGRGGTALSLFVLAFTEFYKMPPLPHRTCRFLAPLLAGLVLAAGAAGAQTIEEKAQVCSACHGENGVPQAKTTPIIWGQNEGYLYLQLRDFNRGSRKNEQMTVIAADLSKDDMKALAAHFTKLAWPDLQQPSAPKDVAAKALIPIGSINCPSCHLDELQGDGTTARLAGQQREYLKKTMSEFRDGTRGNNPGMSDLMKAISPDDIVAIAEYVAGLQYRDTGSGR